MLQIPFVSSLFADMDEGNSCVICCKEFNDMANYILNDRWYNDRGRNKERDAERIITAAAKLIMSEIREKLYDTSTYPTGGDIRNQDVQWLPTVLKVFIEVLVKSTLKQQRIRFTPQIRYTTYSILTCC